MTFCRRTLGNKNKIDSVSGIVISELPSSSSKPTTQTAQLFGQSVDGLGHSPYDSLRKINLNTSKQNFTEKLSENEISEEEGMYDESLETLEENTSFEEKVLKHLR